MKGNEFKITIEIAANIIWKLVTTRYDECISEDLGACLSKADDVDWFSSRPLWIKTVCDGYVVFSESTFVPSQSDSKYIAMSKMIRIHLS